MGTRQIKASGLGHHNINATILHPYMLIRMLVIQFQTFIDLGGALAGSFVQLYFVLQDWQDPPLTQNKARPTASFVCMLHRRD